MCFSVWGNVGGENVNFFCNGKYWGLIMSLVLFWIFLFYFFWVLSIKLGLINILYFSVWLVSLLIMIIFVFRVFFNVMCYCEVKEKWFIIIIMCLFNVVWCNVVNDLCVLLDFVLFN